MKFLLFLLLILLQQEIPYKAPDEFDVTLDYQFKPYTQDKKKDVDYSVHRKAGGSMLYLTAHVKLKKLADNEVRIRVTNNLGNSSVNKKAEQNMTLKIAFGFIEDVKDRLVAHEFTVFLISPDKKEVSKIHLFIDETGVFLVNGQKRGKF